MNFINDKLIVWQKIKKVIYPGDADEAFGDASNRLFAPIDLKNPGIQQRVFNLVIKPQ